MNFAKFANNLMNDFFLVKNQFFFLILYELQIGFEVPAFRLPKMILYF